MMKLRANDLIVFGLSDENISRLRAGRPIFFDGSDVVLPGLKFIVLYGKTEAQMQKDLLEAGFKLPE